jgi:hypothetical protein
LWGLGFVGIAILNGYFVRLALTIRGELFATTTLDKMLEMTELDCATTTALQLCQSAQQAEGSCVNFKLFGSMGLTFVPPQPSNLIPSHPRQIQLLTKHPLQQRLVTCAIFVHLLFSKLTPNDPVENDISFENKTIF